jgi:hypothetical protein
VCLADCGCAGVRAGCGLLVGSKSKSQEDVGGIGGRLQAVVAMCYKEEGGSVGARGVMGVNQTARKRGGGCRNGRAGLRASTSRAKTAQACERPSPRRTRDKRAGG